MQQRLKKGANRVVGTKQVLRALEQDALESVTLALDAAPALRGRIEAAAREKGVPVETVATMGELGRLCQVDVPSAAAGIRKA